MESRQARALALLAGHGALLLFTAPFIVGPPTDLILAPPESVALGLCFVAAIGLAAAYGALAALGRPNAYRVYEIVAIFAFIGVLGTYLVGAAAELVYHGFEAPPHVKAPS